MSVGERQRVAVARALVNRPVLLLADEPTANVDPGHQQQVIDLLREACREEDVAMLLVTHAPEVSDQFERVEFLEEINRASRPLVRAHLNPRRHSNEFLAHRMEKHPTTLACFFVDSPIHGAWRRGDGMCDCDLFSHG